MSYVVDTIQSNPGFVDAYNGMYVLHGTAFTVPTLLSPAHQIPMLGCLEIFNVIGQLLVDVH